MLYPIDMDGRMDIGGFLGLELPKFGNLPQWHWKRGVFVNSGRGALEYILRSLGDIQCIYVPFYTCRTVLELLRRLHMAMKFYRVNEWLELEKCPELKDGEYLLYTNYFGIKEKYVTHLASLYGGRLIVDNALALYSPPPLGSASFYSPRKFSGLPDGGIAIMDSDRIVLLPEERDESLPDASFLLECLEHGVEKASAACERNERRLDRAPLRCMSRLTERLINGIDYERAGRQRIDNFLFLHERLGGLNRLLVDMDSVSVPFCYPFWTAFSELRNILIDERILIPMLWDGVEEDAPSDSLEQKLALHLLPLPVDQRYGMLEMERIATLVDGFYSS